MRDFKAKSWQDSGLKVRGRWDAKNNPWDYEIAQNFGIDLLGTLT